MALATRSGLLTGVASWLRRPGDSIVSDNDDDWLTLAEARIFYGAAAPYESPPLRCRAMESYVQFPIAPPGAGATTTGTANAQSSALSGFTLVYGASATMTAGAGLTNTGPMTLNIQGTGAVSVRKGQNRSTLADGDWRAGLTYSVFYDGSVYVITPVPGAVPLPQLHLEMRRLWLSADPRRSLDPMPQREFFSRHVAEAAGQVNGYTTEGDCILLGPVPDAGYQLHMLSWQRFAALVADSDTNWLLTNCPNAYLYGTLIEAALFLGDTENLPIWRDAFRATIAGLNAQDRMGRYSEDDTTGADFKVRR